MAKIVVLGSFNMDVTVFSNSLPRAGETVLGSGLMQSPGGKGSNQAIAAARLGADVTFIGALGHDSFGDQALAIHSGEQINTDYVVRSTSPTGTALIVVDSDGENQIAVAPGANDDLTVEVVEMAVAAVAAADILLGQLETPLKAFSAAAKLARQASTRVLLNPAPYRALPNETWALVDYVIPNQHELVQMVGVDDIESAAQVVLQRGPTAVVVTRGGDGVTLVTRDGTSEHRALPVKVVDTTGAGDAFTAGLAVALAEGQPIDAAVHFGLLAGAYSVMHRGVLDGLPTRLDLSSLEASSGPSA